MKSLLSSIAAVLLYSAISVAQDVEPNNTLGTASPAPLSTQFSGSLGSPVSDTDDYYIVNLPNNGNVTANVNFGAGLNGLVRIYRTTGTLLSSSSLGTGLISVTENCIGSPQIVIRVERVSGSGSYTLQVNLAQPALNIDAEPNNSSSTSILTVGENEAFTGHIGHSNNGITDGDDYFTYNSPRNGSITFSVVADPGITYLLRIYRPSGSLIASSAPAQGNNSVTLACLQAGTYVGRVERSAGCGSYTGLFSTTTLSQPNDVEPNNSTIQATATFNENQVFTGQIGHTNNAGSTDSDDYFTYNSPRNGDITFTVNADPEITYIVRIYRPGGTLLASSTSGSGQRSVTLVCAQSGTFVGRIERSSGCGSYTASFITTTNPNANDIEPNNSSSETQGSFNENQIVTGHLGYTTNAGSTDSDDYFTYNNPRNGNVTFTVTGDPGLTFVLRIYRPGSSLLASSTVGTGTRSVTVSCLQTGTFVGRVEYSSGCGSYTGSFSTTTNSNPNDTEPNNSSSQTQGIFNENQTVTGQVGYTTNAGSTDSDDYFTYNNPRNGNVTFTVTGDPSLTFILRIYRPGSSLLASSTIGTGTRSVTVSCLQAGTFVGRVEYSSGCGSYAGSFSTSNLTHPADMEPNNSIVTGIFTTTKKFNYGQIGYQTNTGSTDGDDYYAIKITEAPLMLTIPFRFEETLTGLLRLYNLSGSLLASSTTTGPGIDNSLNYNFTTPGVYFIRIEHSSGCGSYRFGAPCLEGEDNDNDNICGPDDDCHVNGGWVISGSQLTSLCVGDGFPDIIQAGVIGRTGIGAYGLVNFPSLNVVATSASGAFNMELYPAGNYRIGHVSVTNLAQFNGITNPSQLTGCFDLSNSLLVSSIALVPGTITATAGTTACGDDGIPSNLTFTSTGAEGPSFRWALLTSDFSTVLANNTTGIFDFDQFGPGSYRVARAVYSGVNPATINPLSLPPCVRVSNIIVINITSCAPALLVQPNPTAGESQVSFTATNEEWHTLEVYDMQGRLVQTLMSQVAQANEQYRFAFDGSYLPNGVYLYRLTTGSDVLVQKFMIAR